MMQKSKMVLIANECECETLGAPIALPALSDPDIFMIAQQSLQYFYAKQSAKKRQRRDILIANRHPQKTSSSGAAQPME